MGTDSREAPCELRDSTDGMGLWTWSLVTFFVVFCVVLRLLGRGTQSSLSEGVAQGQAWAGWLVMGLLGAVVLAYGVAVALLAARALCFTFDGVRISTMCSGSRWLGWSQVESLHALAPTWANGLRQGRGPVLRLVPKQGHVWFFSPRHLTGEEVARFMESIGQGHLLHGAAEGRPAVPPALPALSSSASTSAAIPGPAPRPSSRAGSRQRTREPSAVE